MQVRAREMQEAGVATGEVPNEVPEGECESAEGRGKGDKSPRGSRKGSEDQGEGPSGLSATDKGKGKEIVEETLQEE